MPSNSITLMDEDDEYPDWIELYNQGPDIINFSGYFISDDYSNPYKWQFPALSLEPSDFLILFASEKDRSAWINYWVTIIDWGANWLYLLGTEEPPGDWKDQGFNDIIWLTGISGFGYGDDDDATILPQSMSVYFRKHFSVESISEIASAVLHVDYDDAFVAYLNGVEISRANIGTPGIPPMYNQGAYEVLEPMIINGYPPTMFTIENIQELLVLGDNVLAIQLHNHSWNSSDLTLIPFLSFGYSALPEEHDPPPDILEFPEYNLHTNFSINAGGEELWIHTDDGILIDQFAVPATSSEISWGRVPDGSENWYIFEVSTPGSTNGSDIPQERCPPPVFNPPGIFSQSPVEIEISCENESSIIWYTLDGGLPTEDELVSPTPLTLMAGSMTIIRAVCFQDGFLPSLPTSDSYIIDYDNNLPVMSVITDPDNLWDEETGIYVQGSNPDFFGANYMQDWEIPVHFDFFEVDGSHGLSQDAGARISGRYSRMFPQKSMRLVARNAYGHDRFEYQFFPDLPIHAFKNLILRNGGNDWELAMLRDPLMTGLTKGLNIGYQAYRPVVVFLNGEYWGIHNMRERLDRFYLEDHFGADRDNLDLVEANYGDYYVPLLYADEGDMEAYWLLHSYVEENDLSDPLLFDSLNTMMNVENFMNYQLSEIYFANSDWPGNNNRCWRERIEDGLFEWLVFDLDHGFKNHSHNTLLYATDDSSPNMQNSPQSTLLLRKLLENNEFERRFITRFCDLINFNFKPEYMLEYIDSLSGNIADEMPIHVEHWYSDHDWEAQLDWLRQFASLREDYITEDFELYFNLDAFRFVYINCENPEYGSIKLNGFTLSNFPVLVKYYPGMDVSLSAEPFNEYVFNGWTGDFNSDLPLLTITVDDNLFIQCSFGPDNEYEGEVVITEINYHSSADFDTGDWIELYALDGDFDMSEWQLKDENDDNVYDFPLGTSLNAGEFLVIARTLEDFHYYHPDVQNVIGAFGFGLSDSGDMVRIFNQNLEQIDSVAYSDDPPWPVQADGDGATLQLLDPELPNEFAHNWSASLTLHGTPGRWLAENIVEQDGDLNNDGVIDILDIIITVFCILEYQGLDCPIADLDDNGVVDVLDIVAMVDIILDS